MRYFILIILLSITYSSWAQQDAHYTQFMFNRLYYNPAYAGSTGDFCISAIYRRQWIGIEGAPQTATLNVHAPVWNRRIGLGLTITNDRIGLTDRWDFETSYNYKILFKNKSTLSIGIRGSAYLMQMRWGDAKPTDMVDSRIPDVAASKLVPNFGAGLYYQAKNGYVGISTPHIFRNKLDLNPTTNAGTFGTIEPKFEPHFYAMGGISFAISKKVRIQPNLLLKYVVNAPFDMDINVSFVFFDKFLFGVTYRLGDSVDGMLMWKVAPQFKIAFAYDFSISRLQKYNAGSLEVMLEFCMMKKAEKMHNPRFFF
ncbi:MAG: type IX secretion system membrane protein PorP/SprF [Aureispira sp.]|nr:type IX secretion system membrane protein PorP/SprF [Aureispira sp.]